MKKLVVLLMLFLVFTGYSLGKGEEHDSSMPQSDVELLGRAFSATGASVTGAEFYAWSVISTNYYSPRQAEAAVEIMAQVFELGRDEYTILLRSTGHYGYATMDCDLSDSISLRVQVQSMDEKTIASIEVRQTNHRGIATIHSQIQRALLALAVEDEDVNITSCLEGNVDARLRDSDKLNTVYSAFKAVDAAYQEGVEVNGVQVWNGWSPLFSQSITAGRKDVNFGIAFRPESATGSTIVRIATPVLPGSY